MKVETKKKVIKEQARGHFSMKKIYKNIVLVAIIAVVLYLVGCAVWQMTPWAAYHVVYLQTGDIYFGKLSRFPHLTLTNVWYLQSTGDANNPLGLLKFTNTLWSPTDRLEISRDQVVWMAKLNDAGQVASFLKNPTMAQNQLQNQQQAQPQNQQQAQPQNQPETNKR